MSKEITLSTGAKMPLLGLGTWNASKNVVEEAVQTALVDYNYNHIDCAHVYDNEPQVGEAFHEVFSTGKRNREDVFITSKLWNYDHAREDVRAACERTLKDLRLDYLDLYLIHFGVASPHDLGSEPTDKDGFLLTANIPIRETWEAMQELVTSGLVKAIGVSNFTVPVIIDLLTYADIVPAVNQVELHPYNQQGRLIEFCKRHNISVTAYSPLGSQEEMNGGKPSLLKDPTILEIAQHYSKSPAQILLRWAVERETVCIPKSTNKQHIRENSEIFDFQLTRQDLEQIARLERNLRYVDPYEWWKIPYFG